MSNDLRDTRAVPADQTPTAPSQAPQAPEIRSVERVRRTRTGTIWFGLCGAALLFVVLIVFMLQNTGSVQIRFLWMSGSVPLALALLTAAIGAAIVTMIVGTARIIQLRRSTRRPR